MQALIDIAKAISSIERIISEMDDRIRINEEILETSTLENKGE